MSIVTATVKGTKEQFKYLMDTTNCKLVSYARGEYTLEINLPERIKNHEYQYRFHRLKSISGLQRKLNRHGLTSIQSKT